MNRRGLLAGILAAGVAPAAVGSSILMPVRRIVVPEFNVCGRVKIAPPFADVGLDLANGKDFSVWQWVELSLVDARDWPADDPCRLRSPDGTPFHLEPRKLVMT